MSSLTRYAPLIAALALLAAACGDAATTTSETPPVPVTPATAAPTTVPGTTVPAPVSSTAPESQQTTTTVPPTTTSAPPAPAAPAWSELETVNAPPGRANAVLVIDQAERVAYLHGGRREGTTLGDLWRLDLESGAWAELKPGGDGPAPRLAHTGVWDSRRGRLVVFSGQGQGFGDFFSDVWAYDPAADQWSELAPDGAGPANRYGSCAGYDSTGDRFLISHGFTDDGRFDDTWAFSLETATWEDISPSGERPGERCLHTCGYDSGSGSLVLFGGQDNDTPFLGDTWALSDGAWFEIAGDGPSPRKFPAMAATETDLVLTAGIGGDGRTDDTWQISGLGGSWGSVETATRPPARESHSSAYDSATASVIIFGGTGTGGDLADVWALTGVE